MKISIIITSWNTKKLLKACLHSIYQFSPDEQFEVIVVDNNSHDGSASMVETEFTQVRLIKNAENTGYAKGNNIGFSNSTGEYILLLGSDTEVLPNTIQHMIDFLDKNKDTGIVSCRLEFPTGELQRSCKKFPTIGNAVAMYLSMNFLNKKYLMSDFAHEEIKEIDQPDATCIMIRRTALQQFIFDERFSILYNDVDLCKRIKLHGWKVIFLPTAKIIHHGSQSTKQAPPNIRLVMYQNILLYYQIYFGFYTRFLLAPILFLRFLVSAKSFSGISLLFSTNYKKLV